MLTKIKAWLLARFKKAPVPLAIPEKREHMPARERIFLDAGYTGEALARLNEQFPVTKLDLIHEYSDADILAIKKDLLAWREDLIALENKDREIKLLDHGTGRKISIRFPHPANPATQMVQCEYVLFVSFLEKNQKPVDPVYYYISFANDWSVYLTQNLHYAPSPKAISVQLEKFIEDSALPPEKSIYGMFEPGMSRWCGGLAQIHTAVDRNLEYKMLH